jgi:hypothetical protein
MILSVHQPQYIPWLGYFDKIARSDAFVFLDQVQYKEREFQNRNKIRTDRGALWLTVPVISKGLGRQKISDVLIDYDTDWRKQHLESLKTYYGRAKYFKKYIGFFEDLYDRKWERLGKLNVLIVRFMLKELGIDTPLYYESELGTTATKTERIIELCLKMKAETYLSGSGGRDYLEEEKFKQAGIELVYQSFEHPEYRQQFMRDKDHFLAHLSTVDLLFNEGPGSRKILGC